MLANPIPKAIEPTPLRTVKNDKFMRSALGYVEETLLIAEIVKLLPKFLSPYVGGTLSRLLSSHKTFFASLIPATEQRLRENELKKLGHPLPKRVSDRDSNASSLPKWKCLIK